MEAAGGEEAADDEQQRGHLGRVRVGAGVRARMRVGVGVVVRVGVRVRVRVIRVRARGAARGTGSDRARSVSAERARRICAWCPEGRMRQLHGPSRRALEPAGAHVVAAGWNGSSCSLRHRSHTKSRGASCRPRQAQWRWAVQATHRTRRALGSSGLHLPCAPHGQRSSAVPVPMPPAVLVGTRGRPMAEPEAPP